MTFPMRNDEPGPPPSGPPVPQRRMDPAQLWSGGVATAVVAALIALVGILVCRWLFSIPILAPRRDGAWGDASTGAYVLSAAAAALAATAIMHLLLLATPRPQTFFGWIIALATVIAVVFPFSTTAALSQKLATAVVNLVLGIAIGSLVTQVSARAVRRVVNTGGYPPAYPSSRTPGGGYPPSPSGRGYPPSSGQGYPPSSSGRGYPPSSGGGDYPPSQTRGDGYR
jgi:Family of unknown function (DUF6069)